MLPLLRTYTVFVAPRVVVPPRLTRRVLAVPEGMISRSPFIVMAPPMVYVLSAVRTGLNIRLLYVGVLDTEVAALDRYRMVEPVNVYVWKVGIVMPLPDVATESHVFVVLVAPPPRQRVAPELTVRVPDAPGPVI